MSEEVTVGLDSWKSSVTNLIKTKLGLSDPTEDSNNHLIYKIDGSDAFSRVYSKITRSPEFEYIDNESKYDYLVIELVFTCEYGKVVMTTDLDKDEYKLEVYRDGDSSES